MPRPTMIPGGMVRPQMMARVTYRPDPASNAPYVPGMPRRPYVPSSVPGSSRYASSGNGPRQPHHQGGMYGSRPAYVPRPLTMASLAAMPPEQQKRMLGERLYPLV